MDRELSGHDLPEVSIHNAPEVPLYHAPEVYIEQQGLFFVEDHQSPDHSNQTVDSLGKTPTSPESRAREIICGLRRGHFWLVIAVVALTVAVAAIGGSVGGVFANKSSQSSANEAVTSHIDLPTSTEALTLGVLTSSAFSGSVTPSRTTTFSSTITLTSQSTTFPSTGLLGLDCPDINGTAHTVTASGIVYAFQYHCGEDLRNTDIKKGNSTTIEGCVTQCAEHNTNAGRTDCQGIEWNGNLTSALSRGGNCYLKELATGLTSCGDTCPLDAAAVLVSQDIQST
ncbi:hypothetical protein GGR53DRAFT_525527 [Hypoxylon sp. FL1150]|nr:hypothetical protein GGR53DRAFT_525527 [Hypoxylon sp. FL1150]